MNVSDSVSLTFPDGSVRSYPAGATGRDVAESISKSLAKKAVAIALDGTVRDLSDTVTDVSGVHRPRRILHQRLGSSSRSHPFRISRCG